jgi:hypothetical protein
MAVGFRYLIYAFTGLATGYPEFGQLGRVASAHLPWLGIGFFVLVPVLGGLLYGVADTASPRSVASAAPGKGRGNATLRWRPSNHMGHEGPTARVRGHSAEVPQVAISPRSCHVRHLCALQPRRFGRP